MKRADLSVIGICIRRASDRALLGRFLEESGFAVSFWQERNPDLGGPDRPVLLIVDEASARAFGDRILAAKRAALPLHIPVLLLLPPSAPAGVWMRSGYDDIIREPIGKDELLVRIEAFVRLHRQSETVRDDSEARFHITFDSAPIGIAHVAPNGNLTRVNARFCEILALQPTDLPTFDFATLWPSTADGQAVLQPPRGGRHVVEWQFRRKAGDTVWIRLTISHAYAAKSVDDYLVAILEDITEYKLVAVALGEARDRLITILNSSPLAIWTLDQRGRVTSANPAAETLFGWPARDLMGKAPSNIPPDSAAARDDMLERAFAGEKVIDEHTVRYHRDGTLLHLGISKAPILLDGTAVREIVVTATDITQRVHALQELEAAKADLERRVEERTAELKRAISELEAFAYSVSHDLRTPLRAVSGFARILKQEHPSGAALIERVIAAGDRMGEMIDGLLLLSKASRVDIRHASVDLSAIAHSVIEELRATEPGPPPIVEIEPGMIVRGDEWLLHQLVANLLGNAWKYSSRRKRPRIRFGRRQTPEGALEYFVRDNGAGFDPAHADKLFKPFSRLHSISEFPGSGIGLATVNRILERLEGEIWAQSRPGRGAIFRFRFRDVSD